MRAGLATALLFRMKKIKALRQFSHYHAGNFSQGEVKTVSDDAAEALIGMKLAESADADSQAPKASKAKATKKAVNDGNQSAGSDNG